MTDNDLYTIEAMELYGGSFVRALGGLCRHADPKNFLKIRATWPEYWNDYSKLGQKLKLKGKKDNK